MPKLMGFVYPEPDLIPTNDHIRSVDGKDCLGGFYTNQYLHWDDDNSDGDFGGRIPHTDSVGELSYSHADTEEIYIDHVDEDDEEEGIVNPNFDGTSEKEKTKPKARRRMTGEMSSAVITGTSVLED